MFQFSGFAIFRLIVLQTTGLPHSEILGSICICQSPRLIAAYHVLHRLQEPRHPPCALIYFLLLCSKHSHDRFCSIITKNLFFMIIISNHLLLAKLWYHYQFALVSLSICQRTYSQLLKNWNLWRITDSNRWPPACKAGALASWANPPNLKVKS